MILGDFHVHSSFCDGKDAPETMVLGAIDRGLKKIGIVAHSYLEFDGGYTLQPEMEGEFLTEIDRLKKKYADKIEVLAGVEKDIFSTVDTAPYDYVIGSVHYLERNGSYYAVDQGEDNFVATVKACAGGDFIEAAEQYFSIVKEVVSVTKPNIIGHFDLFTKYNDGNKFFDVSNPRYVRAWKSAVDALIPSGVPFEVNTGGISRGVKKLPYPAPEIIEYIKAKGGKLILNSDAHRVENLCYEFEKWAKLL